MAIHTTEDENRTSKFAAAVQGIETAELTAAPQRRRRRVPRWLTLLVVFAILAGLGVAAVMNRDLLLPAAAPSQILTEKVRRADLIVSITEDGNVESTHNTDIKCEVQGGSTILWIITDGVQVKKGEELVRLDSSTIEDQVNDQEILYERARAVMIESEKLYQAAEIAVQEYKEGLYLQQLQQLKANVTVAKEYLESTRNALQHTIRMHRKGYVTDLQRDAQVFAVQRSELDLQVAETAQEVLEKFTRAKTLVGLESTRDSGKAKMVSERKAFDLEEIHLEQLKSQLENCIIRAPDDGMVIYANAEQSRRSEATIIEEGATVRERQTILRLPDLTSMQVRCTVHESKVDSLERGMRARIRVQDHDYQGTVTSVANQAEPANWFSGNIREYAAVVTIDSDLVGLRPGMTAAVEVLIEHLKNVLTVPVQAVVEKGGRFYCWVRIGEGIEERPVVLGLANNTRIEVKDGLLEGAEVLLNPRAVVESAREEVKNEEQVDVKKRFGGDKPKNLPAVERASGAADKKAPSGGLSLSTFDKDKDGKISQDEAPGQLQKAFSQIDSNGDGFIDAKEFAEMKRRIGQGRPGGGQGGRGGP